MPVLFVLIAIAVIVVVLINQGKRNQQRLRALEQVAQKLGGRVNPGGFLGQPSLEFEAWGVAAKVTFTGGGKNNPAYTNLVYNFPHAVPIECRIAPEYFFHRLGRLFGMQDIATGDPLFDKNFVIRGNSVQAVQCFLQPSVRNAIFKLRALRMNNQIIISTGSNDLFELRLRKLGWIDQPEHLVEFIALSREVLRGFLEAAGRPAMAPPSTEEDVAPGPAPRCPACGDPVDSGGRACPRCGALHHPECWELTDGCGSCGRHSRV